MRGSSRGNWRLLTNEIKASSTAIVQTMTERSFAKAGEKSILMHENHRRRRRGERRDVQSSSSAEFAIRPASGGLMSRLRTSLYSSLNGKLWVLLAGIDFSRLCRQIKTSNYVYFCFRFLWFTNRRKDKKWPRQSRQFPTIILPSLV